MLIEGKLNNLTSVDYDSMNTCQLQVISDEHVEVHFFPNNTGMYVVVHVRDITQGKQIVEDFDTYKRANKKVSEEKTLMDVFKQGCEYALNLKK